MYVMQQTVQSSHPKFFDPRFLPQHLKERREKLGSLNMTRCNAQRVNISS